MFCMQGILTRGNWNAIKAITEIVAWWVDWSLELFTRLCATNMGLRDLGRITRKPLLAVVTPESNPGYDQQDKLLGKLHCPRYQTRGDGKDYEEGIGVDHPEQKEDLTTERYRETEDLESLGKIAGSVLSGVAKTLGGYPEFAGLQQLSIGSLEYINATLKYDLSAMATTPEDQPESPGRQQNLAISYTHRYQRTGDFKDLEAALKYNLLSVAATPDGHPDLPRRQQGLAVSYTEMYRRTGNLENLEASLKYNMLAVAATPESHLELSGIKQNLAVSYAEKYKRTGELQDLEAALKYDLEVVAATPQSHPELPGRQQNLAATYTDRYRSTGNFQDLEAALDYNLKIVAATPEGHPDLLGRWQNLAVTYTERYRRTGNIEDLDAALEYNSSLVDVSPAGHPDLAGREKNLAVSYSYMYKRTGNIEYLEAALKHKQSAVNATPDGHPDLPARQQGLAVSYTDSYRRTGDLKDLEVAIKYKLLAVAATPEGHPKFPSMQKSLAVSYDDRYRRTGSLEDLEAALKYNILAVSMTPDSHPKLPGRQKNLAVSYADRYRRTGNYEDLEAALKHNLSAVAATPEYHPKFPGMQQCLAVLYIDRYKRTGDLGDLESSLKCSLSAVAATPKNHPELPGRQKILAGSHIYWYRRTGNLEDLEDALNYHLAAIANIPVGHPDLPEMWQSLARSYADRYRRTGNLQDLEVSLKYKLSAVAATPEGHASLPERWKSLARSYSDRYRKTRNPDNLQDALKYGLSAVAATPFGHTDLPGRLQSLAMSYIDMYRRTAEIENLHQANRLYQCALGSPTATPQDIFHICVAYVSDHTLFSTCEILKAYSLAFKSLPSIIWMGSSLHSRHETLMRYNISSFVSRAVAFSLQSSTSLAIKYFEQGLSTTHKQKLQLTDDYDYLQAKFPALSQKFKQLSFQLQGSSNRLEPATNYHTLAHEWTALLTQIHQCPGFEMFLLPPNYSHLSSAAIHGPVVMLNFSPSQADAMIILSPLASPLHLSLLDVTESAITDNIKKLKDSLNHYNIYSRNIRHGALHKIDNMLVNESFKSVILWLEKTVVGPVLDILINNGIYSGRLWWCPSGPFTYFPLHAATPIESKFIQSYTPTLEFLIKANLKVTPSSETLTTIGITETSTNLGCWPRLPSVVKELDIVTRLFKSKTQQLIDSQATMKGVLESIQSSSWLHLACHGHQDLENPLNSCLILYNEKLELKNILETTCPNAKFVYLSACETAMGDAHLQNEAMHLAGGFLAAGFQGAIGTLWSMPDAYGPSIAEIVYKNILGEDSVPDVRKAAEGLHLAVQKLREMNAPLHQWMPFIHLGI